MDFVVTRYDEECRPMCGQVICNYYYGKRFPTQRARGKRQGGHAGGHFKGMIEACSGSKMTEKKNGACKKKKKKTHLCGV
jgi:hypothetical protein